MLWFDGPDGRSRVPLPAGDGTVEAPAIEGGGTFRVRFDPQRDSVGSMTARLRLVGP